MASRYSDLRHNGTRWLSKGNVLKRFASLLTETKVFLLEKGVHSPETNERSVDPKSLFHSTLDVSSKAANS